VARERPEIVTYEPGVHDERFARLLEKTYVGTRDCPEVGGRRTGADALAAAQGAGQSALLLAVDSRNDYASTVYDELGFVETDRKGVHVYFPNANQHSSARR
jgi:hypothetical protein